MDTAYPRAPTRAPLTWRCRPPHGRATAMALWPLIEPIPAATAYFGGSRMRLWTWACPLCPSTMVLPRGSASSRHTGPSTLRLLPYRAVLRPLRITTTGYVPSHCAWLRLAYDDGVMP